MTCETQTTQSTTPALREVLKLLAAQPIGAEDLLEKAQAELESLSSVPEDVAREAESFAKYHDEHAGYGGVSWEFHARAATYIRNIATAAARVPGLEAEVKRLEGLAYIGEHHFPDLTWKARCEEEVARRRTAASERDAAQQEVEKKRARIVELQGDTARLTARVAELEREAAQVDAQRKVARERADQRRALVKRTAAALGSNPEEIDTSAAGLWEDVDAANARAEQAEARATAAEAAAGNAVAYLRALAMGGPRMDAEGEAALVSDLEDVLKGKPTPAPGLREAVRKVLEAERVTYGIGNPEGISVAIPYEALRSLRAAYDSVTSEPSVTHAQLAAVVETYAEQREKDGNDFDHAQAEGARELLRRVTGGGEANPNACGDCSQPVAEHRDGGKAESCEARNELAERAMWSIVAPDARPEPAPHEVEVEQEPDGRWLAESRRVNGAMAYGATPEEAVANMRRVELDAAPEVAHEDAQLGAEHWKGRAQTLWMAAWNARAHLHHGRAGESIATLSAALEAATATDVAPEQGALPSFAGKVRRLCHQKNGRHALHLVLNGVHLVLLGHDDKSTRHLLCYLFACPEWRLSVVRESELMREMGRPSVVEPGEGPSRG